jgi:hypothetical protein
MRWLSTGSEETDGNSGSGSGGDREEYRMIPKDIKVDHVSFGTDDKRFLFLVGGRLGCQGYFSL